MKKLILNLWAISALARTSFLITPLEYRLIVAQLRRRIAILTLCALICAVLNNIMP